jgi:TRAP-type C4-dicarboxylate transport system permease small subunit
MLDQLNEKSRKLSQILAWIGGGLLILSVLLITVEVFARKIFNVSLGGADELAGYAFGIATSLSLSFALYERAHIRVDALYNMVPKPFRIFADFLALALLVGFIAIAAFICFELVESTVFANSHSITPLRVPLSYPQIPWLIGFVFCAFSGTLILLTAGKALITGNIPYMQSLIAMKSTDEQIDDETV